MPLVLEVLCGRHFFVDNPNCFCKFTYNGKEFSTEALEGQAGPQWQKGKFQVDYSDGPLEITFDVMNQMSLSSTRIASVTVQWNHFRPGLRKVKDYLVQAEADGVKDTAAIRVAATLLPGVTAEVAQRKGLFIGCSYPGSDAALPDCAQDAFKVKEQLCHKWGFINDEEHVKVLRDDEGKEKPTRPTKRNIIEAIKWLVKEAKAGDSLLFYYSGHGTQTPNLSMKEKDGYDEAICPTDFKQNGIIIDDELHDLLVGPLPEGVRLTCMMDCCHSGTCMDLPFRWSPYMEKGDNKSLWKGLWQMDKAGIYTKADVICISGCADHQVSVGSSALAFGGRAPGKAGMPTGFFTASFFVALEVHETQCKLNWMEMLDVTKQVLEDIKAKQEVQLSSSQNFDLTREFDFHGVIPNRNDRGGLVASDAQKEGATMFQGTNRLMDDDSKMKKLMMDNGVIKQSDIDLMKQSVENDHKQGFVELESAPKGQGSSGFFCCY